NVQRLGSRVLSKLISARLKIEAQGGQLILCGLTPQLREIFAVTRLDSMFRFQDDAPSSSSPEEPGAAEPDQRPEGSLTAILVRDPDPARANRLKAALGQGGLRVALANDLKDVVRCCRGGTVAVVAVPLEWPGADGGPAKGASAELLEFIHKHGQHTAIVV